jgi:hypothetical protein
VPSSRCPINALIIRAARPRAYDNPQNPSDQWQIKELQPMQLVGPLIAISLLLLVALGVAALFMAGRSSRSANDDDPDPR